VCVCVRACVCVCVCVSALVCVCVCVRARASVKERPSEVGGRNFSSKQAIVYSYRTNNFGHHFLKGILWRRYTPIHRQSLQFVRDTV
jgi:hypothetical protein